MFCSYLWPNTHDTKKLLVIYDWSQCLKHNAVMILRCNLKSVGFKGICYYLACPLPKQILLSHTPLSFQGSCRAAEIRSDIPLPLESTRFHQSLNAGEFNASMLCAGCRLQKSLNHQRLIASKIRPLFLCLQSYYFILQLKLARQMTITSLNNSKNYLCGIIVVQGFFNALFRNQNPSELALIIHSAIFTF